MKAEVDRGFVRGGKGLTFRELSNMKKKKKNVKKDFHSSLLCKSFTSRSLGSVSDNSLQRTGGQSSGNDL